MKINVSREQFAAISSLRRKCDRFFDTHLFHLHGDCEPQFNVTMWLAGLQRILGAESYDALVASDGIGELVVDPANKPDRLISHKADISEQSAAVHASGRMPDTVMMSRRIHNELRAEVLRKDETGNLIWPLAGEAAIPIDTNDSRYNIAMYITNYGNLRVIVNDNRETLEVLGVADS